MMLSCSLRRTGLLAAALLGLAARLSAQTEATPTASGRQSVYDANTGELVLTGEARLAYRDVLLSADEIHFDRKTRTATARGNVVLTSGHRRVVADEGTYQIDSGTLHVHHLRLGQFPIYVYGDSVDGTIDDFTITNATLFLREHAGYVPSIKARKLVYRKGRIVTGEGMELGFLGGHFISLPYFEHDLQTKLISYLSGTLGYRHNLGVFAETGLHLPVAAGVTAGAEGGLYSARGLLLGPVASYAREGDGVSMHGFLRSGFIHDYGDRKLDVLDHPIPHDRSYVTWEHQQTVGEQVTIAGEFNYWSDSAIIRDFRPKDFFPVQQPDSFLETAYTGGNFILSAFTRVRPNHFELVQERLPEIRFDLLPGTTPITGLYQRFNSGFAVLEQGAYQNLAKLRSTRLDVFYGLERPVPVTPWFTFTPVAGARFTHYADAVNGRSTYDRSIGEVGFDAVLRAGRTFDYQNPLWEIDGLRHLVEPRLSYRYAPEAAHGQAYIPAIDTLSFNTYLPPLDLGDQRNTDQLSALDTMRLTLHNTLQTRDAAAGTRDLAMLDLAADYQFSHRTEAHPLSNLHTGIALLPAAWLRLDAYERMSFQDHRQNELNYSVTVIDQSVWSVTLGSYFLHDNYDQYALDCRRRLNEVYDVTARWRYDVRLHRMNEQTYGVTQHLGQTWLVRYEVSLTRGSTRESSFGFNVALDLLKF